ncbi:MAG: hypothetical protein OES78_04595 [Chromatiales bacterium]|nr:hypothetical protein [Chromatiales bacterium]MDH3893821.1 hypothetical protein [Chromatiales bacterium]MDH3933258.1 hypothetical protein [Chromatiales bacterium]
MSVTRLLSKFVVCLVLCVVTTGRETLAFQLDDIVGDDNGAGFLFYPNREDMRPGDLDIVWMRVENDDDGTWFTVRFRNPIQSPRGRVTMLGQTPLEQIVRHDFFTFNLDLYIDIDRVENSGILDTAPSREVRVDPDSAWERAVLLTPRPDVGQSLLDIFVKRIFGAEEQAELGRLSREDWSRIRARARERVEELVSFPRTVRVSGRQLKFFVPREFLGAAASQDWAYTVIVTGADVEQLMRTVRPGQAIPMMVMPISMGRSYEAFGLPVDHDLNQSPVVDYLSSDPTIQAARLSDYDLNTGRLASLPGVVPSGAPARPGSTDSTLAFSSSSEVTPAPAPAGTGSPGETDPAWSGQRGEPAPIVPAPAAGATSAAGAGPGVSQEQRRTIAARLKTLQTLRQAGLITEQEYQEIRRKILSQI